MALNERRIRKDRGVDILNSQMLPSNPELNSTRAVLSQVARNQIALPPIPSITMYAPASSRPQGENCGSFLLGTFHINVGSVLLGGVNLVNAEPNSIIFYFNERGDLMHTGLVAANLSVISKWDATGPVVLHNPELVPIEYGNTVMYFRMQ